MRKWKTSIIIFAILLTTVFALAGCTLKPEKMVENAIATWTNATEKSVTDTIEIKDLVVGASAKGLEIPVLTISLQAQIMRSFTATETSIEANLQLIKMSVYPIVESQLGIKLDQTKASGVKISAKIVLVGTNININIASEGLKAFIITPATEEINYITVVSVSANPLIANLFRDSADAISFGKILTTGELYDDTNTYIYSIPKESALATVTSQYASIFNAIKDLSLEDGGETIADMLKGIFNTSDFNTILASIFTGSEMEVRAHLNRENKAYFFDKMSTNTHLYGSIKGDALRRILNKMPPSDLINQLDIEKGITLSTSNSSGVTLKSSYAITKFGK